MILYYLCFKYHFSYIRSYNFISKKIKNEDIIYITYI